MKIFDSHVHIFPEKIAEKATNATGDYYKVPMYSVGTLENILKEVRAGKMTKCLIHSTATKSEQVQNVNDYISSLCKEYSDDFIGFGTMHPDFDDIPAEVGRISELGLYGIKIHSDFQHFALDDKKAFPIYESAKGKLPMLFHIGDKNTDFSHPKKLRKIHDMFPDLTIIAAHLGGYSVWDEGEEYLAGTSGNVYFDLSSALEFMDSDRAKKIILKHGTDRILFGSDFPMHDPLNTLKLLEKLKLSDSDMEKILYKNAENLLNIKI